jgi:hypothetical protein
MASISRSVHTKFRRILVVIPFLFALPICSIAADQSAVVNLDSNQLQPQNFLKQFSAKDLLKQPSVGEFTKNPPLTFITIPESSALAEVRNGKKQCSIPLLEARATTSFDTGDIVRIPSRQFDTMIAPNPAPACKSWNEKHH